MRKNLLIEQDSVRWYVRVCVCTDDKLRLELVLQARCWSPEH